MNNHEVAPRETKVGRSYRIDPAILPLIYDVPVSQELILIGNERENVMGISEEAFGQYKTGVSPVYFEKIKSNFNGEPQNSRLGIIRHYEERSLYDLVRSDSNQVIIPRDTNVVALVIPTVIFSPFSEDHGAVSLKMVTDSLNLIARNMLETEEDAKFVMGMTHPRMGRIAEKRWGFHTEEHPYPKEVYDFFDTVANYEDVDSDDLKELDLYRNQVLVYMTREEFLQRYGQLAPIS